MSFRKVVSGSMAVMMMAGMMVGCGGKNTTDVSSTNTPVETQETTQNTTQATTQNATGATQATTGGAKGSIDGNVYTNTAAGFTYTLPSEVTFSSSTSSLYDMMAQGKVGEVLFVMVQDVGVSGVVSEEGLASMLKDQMANQFEGVKFNDIKKVNVGGVEFTDLTYSFTQGGVSMSQVMLVKSVGSKMVVVNATYLTEESRTKLLSGLKAL